MHHMELVTHRGKKSQRVKYFAGYYLNSSFAFSPLRIMLGGDTPLAHQAENHIAYFILHPLLLLLFLEVAKL